MKTDKYNNMLQSFAADFTMARDGEYSVAYLDAQITSGNERLLRDIELLSDLEFGLRYGLVEIHVVDKQ